MKANKYHFLGALIFLCVGFTAPASAQNGAWWTPTDPQPGDTVTIFYDVTIGTLPDNATQVKLHWGMNGWHEPPSSMWPAGTVPWGDNAAVQSPMIQQGSGVFAVAIITNDTTYSLNFVFTTGTQWDNNNNNNWNIYLEEPPPPTDTYHTFIYDTRSAFATYGVSSISTIRVAGTFNNWSSSANPLSGPDSRGVYSAEILVPAGFTGYKFVINSNVWLQDPDNPLTDGSSYMNSAVTLTPDSLPYFANILPFEGAIYNTGQTASISALLRPSDFGPGIQGQPALLHNGSPISVNYNPASGQLSAHLLLTTAGVHTLTFSAADSSGGQGSAQLRIGAYPAGSGYHALDPVGDHVGDGDYSYIWNSDQADLWACAISEIAAGDSLRFSFQMADLGPETRVLLQICTTVDGFYFDAPGFATEVATPDWNGNGVQLCLANPNYPPFDPSVHNRLITLRSPMQTGAAVALYPAALVADVFQFDLALADLTAVLGSYNRGWYFGAYAFFDDPSGITLEHCWEVDSLHGGIDAIYDSDAFDALFMNSRDLQQTIFSNYSGNRRCTLDNVGRGFALIEPEEIGPNVGSSGPVVSLLTRGASTITAQQTIIGVADLASPATVIVHQSVGLNDITYPLPGIADTFIVVITLEFGANTLWAEVSAAGDTSLSPAIVFDLSVEQAPEPEIVTSAVGNMVTLDASGSSEPQGEPMSFYWTADPDNPESIDLINPDNAICTFQAPATVGEYYLNLAVEDTSENVSHARTLATVYPDSVHPFDWNESVQWVRDAIVYEIFPRSYSANHQLSSITADLQRIYDFGFNAIWLMPIFPGPTDHGYEITDYYGIEQDYGDEADFADLVQAAHSYGIKIILDLVANHTSIQHLYMQDAIAFGPFSHYWDFYDRDAQGNYTYYYDWASLPNVNYDNPEVWDYFIKVSKYWIETYDVDGFRCDVAWGPQSRHPGFWIAWREALKEIKPEAFLLAEADCGDFTYFDHRFDAAMDWNFHHNGPVNLDNIFPGPPNLNDLHTTITNWGYPFPRYHYPFRFLENHDEARYISYNTVDETKLAATLLFAIPGIPMVYAGQEIGTTSQRGQIQWGVDPNNFADTYYKLAHVRNLFPALRTDEITRLNNNQYGTVYSIARTKTGENPVIAVFNFASWSQVVQVTVPTATWGLNPDSLYCLCDLLGGSAVWKTGAELATLTTSLDAKKARIYAIADTAIIVPVELEQPPQQLPQRFSLEQNYPNPFNSECVIRFSLPQPRRVELRIYNLRGQLVSTLAEGSFSAGEHIALWEGRSEAGAELASGVYFCRLQAGEFQAVRKLVLVR